MTSGDAERNRLEALRNEIRALDEQLVILVGRRRTLAIEIGAEKEALGLPVMDPTQEARVVRRAAEIARELGVDEELTRDVIWRIIASARDAQEGRTRWGPPPVERDQM
jgi:chorismate mutase